jgi:hypothetical protein
VLRAKGRSYLGLSEGLAVMMRKLTRSDSPAVNTFFFVSLIASLAPFNIAPVLAWLRQSNVTPAVEWSAYSLILWWAMLGVYRLIRGQGVHPR